MNKNVNMAMDVPTEEDYQQELTEAWDDIDGQELDPETVKKGTHPGVREKIHRRVLREDQEAARQGEVGRPQQRRQTTHEREVEACGKANQHRQGTRVVRSNSTTRGTADAAVSNGHRGQAQGVDVQRLKSSVHVRTGVRRQKRGVV